MFCVGVPIINGLNKRGKLEGQWLVLSGACAGGVIALAFGSVIVWLEGGSLVYFLTSWIGSMALGVGIASGCLVSAAYAVACRAFDVQMARSARGRS